MKKIIGFLIVFLMIASISHAAPFVLCDPYTDPNTMPDEFIVAFDSGVTESIPYSLHSSGAAIIYDLDGIAPGNHTIEVRAKNAAGESGVVTWNFLLPGVPLRPSGLGVLWE